MGEKCNIYTFVSDIQLGGSVGCKENVNRLHGDTDKLSKQARTCQIEHNVEKCECVKRRKIVIFKW